MLVLVVAAGAIVVASASATLSADPSALARVGMPLGGGRIESVSVLGGRTTHAVPVVVRGDRDLAGGAKIPAGESLSIQVVVKRPGWISWLSGKQDRVHLSLVAPAAAPTQTYLTLGHDRPLRLAFDRPVAAVLFGTSATQLKRELLASPSTEVTLPRTASAGTIWVAATPRPWETAPTIAVSWFPAGAATSAVANPAPGGRILPTSPITLTFSKPLSSALGGSLPTVSPAGSGSWQKISSHTLVFRPVGYGYGLGATVRIGLPSGVRLAGGAPTWTVAPGSTLRLQQLLASLGYLPVTFSSAASVASSPGAQENAAITPPSGSFSWRWGNVPGGLRSMWQQGAFGPITKGAVMAFENDQGLDPRRSAGSGQSGRR